MSLKSVWLVGSDVADKNRLDKEKKENKELQKNGSGQRGCHTCGGQSAGYLCVTHKLHDMQVMTLAFLWVPDMFLTKMSKCHVWMFL